MVKVSLQPRRSHVFQKDHLDCIPRLDHLPAEIPIPFPRHLARLPDRQTRQAGIPFPHRERTQRVNVVPTPIFTGRYEPSQFDPRHLPRLRLSFVGSRTHSRTNAQGGNDLSR